MAEEEQIVESDEGEGTKKKIPLWVFVLIGGQLVVVGGLIIAFVFISGRGTDTTDLEPTSVEQRTDPSRVRDAASLIGPQFSMSPFIVNLLDDGRGPRFLKLEVVFELESDDVRPELTGRLSQVTDELLMLLSAKRVTDVETPDGKRILKDEIFTRVNKILVTGRIRRVYFTDFVIQ